MMFWHAFVIKRIRHKNNDFKNSQKIVIFFSLSFCSDMLNFAFMTDIILVPTKKKCKAIK